jgi:hypothetical protein
MLRSRTLLRGGLLLSQELCQLLTNLAVLVPGATVVCYTELLFATRAYWYSCSCAAQLSTAVALLDRVIYLQLLNDNRWLLGRSGKLLAATII